jgi:hypothetical protein
MGEAHRPMPIQLTIKTTPMVHYENLPSISIYDLLKGEYLTATTQKPFTITIQNQLGDHTNIQLSLTTNSNQPCLALSDPENDPNNDLQSIKLFTKPFNLNKGSLWYFSCPSTGIPCRKLYYYNGCFQSRQSIKGRYTLQSVTPKIRKVIKQFTDVQKLDKMRQKITAPYRRSTYAGSPTTSTKRILAKMKSMS